MSAGTKEALRSFTVATDIVAPAEEVWPVMAEVVRWPAWLPTVAEVTPLGAVPLAVGGRYRVVQPKLPPAIWTVVNVDAVRFFSWESHSPGVRVLAEHVVEPVGATASRVTLRITFSGPLRWLAVLVGGRITREYMAREAVALKRRVESRIRVAGAAAGAAASRG